MAPAAPLDVEARLREMEDVSSLSFQRDPKQPVRTEFPKIANRLLAKREAHDAAVKRFQTQLNLISDDEDEQPAKRVVHPAILKCRVRYRRPIDPIVARSGGHHRMPMATACFTVGEFAGSVTPRKDSPMSSRSPLRVSVTMPVDEEARASTTSSDATHASESPRSSTDCCTIAFIMRVDFRRYRYQ